MRSLLPHFPASPLAWAALFLLSLGGMMPVTANGRAQRIVPDQPDGQPMPNQPPSLSPQAPVIQGNQVAINGKLWPIAWTQGPATAAGGSSTLGVSDAGLVQQFGIRLLNTATPAQQPVAWFSDPRTEPLLLATQLTAQNRHLNIMPLVQRAGWRLQTQGSLLSITTVPAAIVDIRYGQQVPAGERMVLNLDRATPYQVISTGKSIKIAIEAQLPPSVGKVFQANAVAAKSVQLQSTGNRTVLAFNPASPRYPRVWTLPNPNRLIIDLQTNPSFDPLGIQWAPGLLWRQEMLRLGNTQFPATWFVINPRQPGVALRPIWSEANTLIGTNPLALTVQRWQAIAGINGGFFNRDRKLPLGAIRQNNRWISSPILNRGAIAWDEMGSVLIGRLNRQETLTTQAGQRLPLQSLNSGYVQAGIARYTPAWGPSYTPINQNETILTVQDDQVINQQTVTTADKTAIAIPQNGYLLVVRSNQLDATVLAPGMRVSLESVTQPSDFDRYPYILGAGPLLVQNRQLVLDPKAEKFSDAFVREAAPRSGIGRTSEGQVLIATVQQRLGGDGPTLSEMAQLMQQLGAVDALNLDGGSSTTLYLGGQLLNRSVRSSAKVHNGIGIFIQPDALAVTRAAQ
jgi:hypothetical protein